MFQKNDFKLRTIFCLLLLGTLLATSCKEEEASGIDPITKPLADFYISPIAYKVYDGNTYGYVTVRNGSSFSNRWKWSRPDSYEPIGGAITFETTSYDTIITQAYLATSKEQTFTITLTAYYDAIIPPDSTATYVSNPFSQEVTIKMPPSTEE